MMYPKTILKTIMIIVLLASVSIKTSFAVELQELSDSELDLITAGAATVNRTDNLASFEVTKTTRSGKTITADGSFQLVEAIGQATIGSLTLSSGAQDNLRSLININAVNSAVNVLLNLNINIDSNVGTLNQSNINGVLPLLMKSP